MEPTYSYIPTFVQFTYDLCIADGQYKTLPGHFSQNDVHKQYGISFHTPAFPHINYGHKVEAQMYLAKKDGTTSDSVPFTFVPTKFKEPQEAPPQEQRPIQVAMRQTNKRDRIQMKQQIINNEIVQEESTGNFQRFVYLISNIFCLYLTLHCFFSNSFDIGAYDCFHFNCFDFNVDLFILIVSISIVLMSIVSISIVVCFYMDYTFDWWIITFYLSVKYIYE